MTEPDFTSHPACKHAPLEIVGVADCELTPTDGVMNQRHSKLTGIESIAVKNANSQENDDATTTDSSPTTTRIYIG